jgi:microsomal dipeptidase-like Zn-dependent dipeptidase
MNIDIHTHPTIKAFGHTCKLLLKNKLEIIPRNFNIAYLQTNYPKILKKMVKPCRKSSIWHNKKPHFILNKFFAELFFARYSESNFTDAIKGDTRIVFTALYPIEKEYMTETTDEKVLGIPVLKNFITGISDERIDYIQSEDYKYFNDLECEYEYLQTLQNFPGRKNRKYFIAKDFSHLNTHQSEANKDTVAVVLTIEGTNNFYPTKYVNKTHISEVLLNIEKVKQWEHKVLWVTLAHHFYNGFVSHEKSLITEVVYIGNIDQEEGMNQPVSEIPNFTYFTEEGIQIINTLLSTENGRRILIDLKHTDHRGRRQYYELIRSNYENKVPVIISHAAVGSPDASMPSYFNPWTINVNDDDIYAVCSTKGIIGLVLDQRVLGFNELIQYKKVHHLPYYKIGKKFSIELCWNSIRYIAEKVAEFKTFDSALPVNEPWDIICIGSDYDGVINPINQFPTLAQMPELRKELTKAISNYMNSADCNVNVKTLTTSTPEQIIEKIFYGNAYRFLEENFS